LSILEKDKHDGYSLRYWSEGHGAISPQDTDAPQHWVGHEVEGRGRGGLSSIFLSHGRESLLPGMQVAVGLHPSFLSNSCS
jgi:hypothetical protein